MFLAVLGIVSMAAGVAAMRAIADPPAYPDRVVHVPSAEHEETIRTGRIAAKRTNELIPRDHDLGIRVSMGRKLATPPVSEAEVHADFGHIYIIEEGGGTLLLGGELVNPTQRGQMWVAASIKGGRRYELKTGDMITVQVGMPHQWVKVPRNVSYLAFHSFPEHNQPR
jgi:mannose-6-phosphate isomerase-like protein (cupin superfamily)